MRLKIPLIFVYFFYQYRPPTKYFICEINSLEPFITIYYFFTMISKFERAIFSCKLNLCRDQYSACHMAALFEASKEKKKELLKSLNELKTS